MRCRDFQRRLRIRAAFGVRPLAGAFGLLVLSKSATALGDLRPTPAFLPRPEFWRPDHIHRWRPRFHPSPGLGGPRTGGIGLQTAKLRLQSSFRPPQPSRWRGGSQKTGTRPRIGGFPSKGCNSLSEQPSSFARFVPVSVAGTLGEKEFWLSLPSPAVKR